MAQVYKDKSEDNESADKSENTEEPLEDEVNENENWESWGVLEPVDLVWAKCLQCLDTV